MPDKLEILRIRAHLYHQIRAFFAELNYLEVDTPLLGRYTNPDVHIQSVRAIVNSTPCYLQTSPEFCMKRLLCEECGSIYQICHAFRDEESGSRHAAEFTLLEWYSLGFDYRALMQQLQQLLSHVMPGAPTFSRIRYFDCFRQQLDLDLVSASVEECQNCVTRHVPGIDACSLSRDDCLDLLISTVIARNFSGFTFVYDYPASQASLARINAENPLVAERFELFYDDLELANGFSELTDARQQRQRFEQDNEQRRQYGLAECTPDEALLRALDQGLPECAGVALGLDRLMMVMTGLQTIDQVKSIG